MDTCLHGAGHGVQRPIQQIFDIVASTDGMATAALSRSAADAGELVLPTDQLAENRSVVVDFFRPIASQAIKTDRQLMEPAPGVFYSYRDAALAPIAPTRST
jgi:hypothetical protein